MFWVRIRLGGREYLGVLDTGATISIVAKKILPCGSLKNTMTTAAIRMGHGHVVHSCGDCEVEVPMGSRTIAHRFYVMDTEAFDFVLGTDFFVQHSQIQSLTRLSAIGGSPRPRSEGVGLLSRRPECGVVRQRQATCTGPILQQGEELQLQILLALFRDGLREPQVQ